jgi:hypothetical protein
MKPFRIFLFGLSIFFILFLFSLAFQNTKLKLWGIPLKVPTVSAFFSHPTPPRYKDISHIIKLGNLMSESEGPVADSTANVEIKPDTSKKVVSKNKSRKVKVSVNPDSVRSLFRKIEFPPQMDTLLFPFFDEISSASANGKLIRILHYGDSQIEGDRITSYLRNQLQTKFGGNGIGMFSMIASNPASISYMYTISGNWKKYSPLPGFSEENLHKRYGALINFALLGLDENKSLNGSITLKYPVISYPLAQRSQQCGIFYGFNKAPVLVEVKKNNAVTDAEILPVSSSLKEFQWDISSPRDVSISFKTDQPLEIYGMCLDGKNGVAVDNIPLRGSSGLEFTKIDFSFLQDFYRLLNVKLLILQFGANVVPNVTGNYQFYEHSFYKQLIMLKQTVPNLQILVIGVNDISRNGENGYESYPNVEKIRDAQRNAAFNANCLFWDTYEAMGGHNSMPSWVLANPPLAQKDFVHFSPLGAKIIGEMFCRSFMHEYDRYLDYRSKGEMFAGVKP